jgi:hypothetical protein
MKIPEEHEDVWREISSLYNIETLFYSLAQQVPIKHVGSPDLDMAYRLGRIEAMLDLAEKVKETKA